MKKLFFFLFLYTASVAFSQQTIVVAGFPKARFDYKSANLSPAAKDSLNYTVKVMLQNPTIVMQLEGNSDNREEKELNIALSLNRAQACKNYIASQGIDSVRLVIKGWGSRKAIVDPDIIGTLKSKAEREAAYQVNRRVEMRVANFSFIAKTTYLPGASVHFAANDSTLTQANKDSMKAVLRILHRYSGPVIEIDVFGDGNAIQGLTFKDGRLNACRNYMIDQGIDPARLIIGSFYPNSRLSNYPNQVKFKILPVYYVPLLKPVWFTIKGTVTDSKTHKPIANATVHMIGTDLSNIPHQTDAQGHYEFYPYDFNPGVAYQLKCVSSTYSVASNQAVINTEGLKESKEFDVDFQMMKK